MPYLIVDALGDGVLAEVESFEDAIEFLELHERVGRDLFLTRTYHARTELLDASSLVGLRVLKRETEYRRRRDH